jgi:hypothetical protein
MTNIFQNLWNLATEMITVIGTVWDWLNTNLVINIPITIPVIFPDGINFDLGFAPIWLLGGGIITLIVFWVVFK